MSSSLSSVESRNPLCSSGNNIHQRGVDRAATDTAEQLSPGNPHIINEPGDIITPKRDEVEEVEEALSALEASSTKKMLGRQCDLITHRESTNKTTETKSSSTASEQHQQQPRDTKRRKISQQKRTVLVSVMGNATARSSSEDVPADLWAWRKYGQKPIKGSPYPRGYYRCSSSKGCLARKQVERSHKDPSMLIVSYSAEHNHPWPSHRNSLAGSTRVTSASKLAKVHESSASDRKKARTTTISAVITDSLEKQKSSSMLVTQRKSESEEQQAPSVCHDHFMEKELTDFEDEKEIANGSEADEESKGDVGIMSMPSYKVEQSSAKTTSGFSTSICHTQCDNGAGSSSPQQLHEDKEPSIVNVQVSSGEVQINADLQLYAAAAASCDHVGMLESLYRSSSSMDHQPDEDFFAELEELNVPDSSMAAFGWGRQSSFLEDQSDDEGVGSTMSVVDPYSLFCWSTTTSNSCYSSVETKAMI